MHVSFIIKSFCRCQRNSLKSLYKSNWLPVAALTRHSLCTVLVSSWTNWFAIYTVHIHRHIKLIGNGHPL